MRKSVRVLAIASISFCLAMLIINPSRYMQAVSEGVMLFCISVLPSMLPFFFFSKLLTSLNVADTLSRFTSKPTKLLFNAPDVGGYVLAVSMLSGYPIGAKLVADCYESGICSKQDAKRLIAFTSTSGPLFVLGTVGINMFDNYYWGLIILVSHYLSALLNGLIFRGRKKSEDNASLKIVTPYNNVLADAMNGSIAAVLSVGGYIAILNMVIAALSDVNFLPLVTNALASLGIERGLGEGFSVGLIEITRGSLILSQSGLTASKAVPTAAALISFGGLSVTLQSLTFLTKCGITARYYLLTKATQALTTFFIALLLTAIFL